MGTWLKKTSSMCALLVMSTASSWADSGAFSKKSRRHHDSPVTTDHKTAGLWSLYRKLCADQIGFTPGPASATALRKSAFRIPQHVSSFVAAIKESAPQLFHPAAKPAEIEFFLATLLRSHISRSPQAAVALAALFSPEMRMSRRIALIEALDKSFLTDAAQMQALARLFTPAMDLEARLLIIEALPQAALTNSEALETFAQALEESRILLDTPASEAAPMICALLHHRMNRLENLKGLPRLVAKIEEAGRATFLDTLMTHGFRTEDQHRAVSLLIPAGSTAEQAHIILDVLEKHDMKEPGDIRGFAKAVRLHAVLPDAPHDAREAMVLALLSAGLTKAKQIKPLAGVLEGRGAQDRLQILQALGKKNIRTPGDLEQLSKSCRTKNTAEVLKNIAAFTPTAENDPEILLPAEESLLASAAAR